MKTKQLIERNLKFSEKYVYIELVRGSIESGQMTCCDNCGKLITNMVHIVRKSDNKHLIIGTDCTETLVTAQCLYNNGTATDYQTDIYSYNMAARFVTEMKKGCEVVKDSFRYSLINTKGKAIFCWTNDLKKYFPQLKMFGYSK